MVEVNSGKSIENKPPLVWFGLLSSSLSLPLSSLLSSISLLLSSISSLSLSSFSLFSPLLSFKSSCKILFRFSAKVIGHVAISRSVWLWANIFFCCCGVKWIRPLHIFNTHSHNAQSCPGVAVSNNACFCCLSLVVLSSSKNSLLRSMISDIMIKHGAGYLYL